MRGHPIRQGNNAARLSTSHPLETAFGMLLRAYQYAFDTRQDPWQFAVEIEEFRRAGVSKSELRWMIGKKLAVFGRELTNDSVTTRRFERLENQALPPGTCLILSPHISKRLVEDNARSGRKRPVATIELRLGELPSLQLTVADTHIPPRRTTPKWDRQRRELCLEGQLIKRFRTAAPNQETVLTAFEEENWAPRIDDPLHPVPDQDSSRRLLDTIKSLNRSQIDPLIRFQGDGTGRGILWLRTA